MGSLARAEVKVTVDRNEGDKATADFKFKTVPSPAKTSVATKAKFTIVDGEKAGASAELDALNDGKLPDQEDQPDANFFFEDDTEGGRIAIDLGKVMDVGEFNSYSWHPNTRGAQVYTLYGSDGTAKDFNAAPKNDVNPEKAGWKMITKVDTRSKTGEPGGQYGVSITNTDGTLGKFRYLLMVVSRTESDDTFGNTFYSEITIAEAKPAAPGPAEGGKLVTADKPVVLAKTTTAVTTNPLTGNVTTVQTK
jgi:hypothetical protein